MKKFTLIEILVVVAIIGILSSLLLPSLSSARDKSRASVCKNNLKQIGLGAYLYADDNNGNLIVSRPGGGHDGWWANVMYTDGYLPIAKDAMTCPSMPLSDVEWAASYKARAYGVVRDKYGNKRDGVNMESADLRFIIPAEVESAREFFHYADSAAMHNGEFYQAVTFWWDRFQATQGSIHLRHDNKPNIWFIDGHVQGHSIGSLGQLGFHGGWTKDQVQLPF
ncbi:type II secretion system protein [Lentisphaera marina]|uniref:type II secretion system protein n=1 Tax=Lentisphaera marina TaxID=1111041 RepID=UPI0023655200|nr:type II secretion system protein [Lentisphaera marina]MDD7985057.1 type II secretion system protein [Lentisphaera marina]